ncbi:MAG: T9SS type A sorting domain-containing protein [Bacteroidia bacterium]
MLNSKNYKSENVKSRFLSGKTITTKKLLAFIIMVMFSFTFVNAQPCNGNKIRVYKCSGISFGCHSKCGFPNNSWLIYCPCNGRIANEQAGGELSTLDVSPNPVSGSSVIYFFLEQSQNVSLNIFDVNGRLVTTLANKMFEEGENEISWNAADVNAGIYFLRMESASYSENRKLIVTK